MLKQRRIAKDNLIVTHFGGRHTYSDALKALEGLLEINSGNKHIYEIVINDDDIELDFSEEEERLITKKVVHTFEHFERGALAVVSNNDFVFGLTRMLTATIKNELIAISVFRSEPLARKWIHEVRSLHKNEISPTD